MKNLSIYLVDGTYNGAITMNSASSSFTAIRVRRENVDLYESDMDHPGVYMLLIGKDTVYVGQSGLNKVKKRIMGTHSGEIDSAWHTVVGFCCIKPNISSNELLFIENALCEYAHDHYPNCVTTSPARKNCNAAYRNQHFNLLGNQIHECNRYVEDIKYYISMFGDIFSGYDDSKREKQVELKPHDPLKTKRRKSGPKSKTHKNVTPQQETAMFYYHNEKRDAEGTAEIVIHTGDTKSRKTILKAGSRISSDVSMQFGTSEKVIAHRKKLKSEGKIIDRVLQVDVPFPSQSGAGKFLSGTSINGNIEWKTYDGIPLERLVEVRQK